MSDKCLRSLLHSIGVETAVWLFCANIPGSQESHMHPTSCIFREQKGILIRCKFLIKSKTWRTLIPLLFLFFSIADSRAEKKNKRTCWLIQSVLTFADLHFNQQQSTKLWNKDNNKMMMMMMMMVFLLQATAAEGQEMGVCFKSSTVHLHHSFLYLRDVMLFKAGPSSLCSSGPSKTPHSWQQIITGMKWKVEPFYCTFNYTSSAPPGPTGEITSPPPSFFPAPG